jgi:hypothetical protein
MTLCAICFFVFRTTIVHLAFLSSPTTPPPFHCSTKPAPRKVAFTTMNNDTQQRRVSSISPCLESKTSDRSSTVSAGSLDPWSLERYIYPQQPIPTTRQQDRPSVYIPDDIELTSSDSQETTNSPEWAGSPQSTLVNEAGVSPAVRVSTLLNSGSPTSVQINLTNLPGSESMQDPPKAYGGIQLLCWGSIIHSVERATWQRVAGWSDSKERFSMLFSTSLTMFLQPVSSSEAIFPCKQHH